MKRKDTNPLPVEKKRKDDLSFSQEFDAPSISQTINTFVEFLKGVNLATNPITIDDAMETKNWLIKKIVPKSGPCSSFIVGFSGFIGKEENLLKSLSPIKSDKDAPASVNGLCRLLLNVPALQAGVALALVRQIPTYGVQVEDENLPTLDKDVVRLILNAFRYVLVLGESRRIAQELWKAMEQCPMVYKREIVGFVPSIVEDSDQEEFLGKYERLFREDGDRVEIAAAVLDAVTNFSLKLAESPLLDLVMDRLESCDALDVPMFVSFLVKVAEESNAQKIANALRTRLNFKQIALDLSEKDVAQNESLILNALKIGLAINKNTRHAFLKEIEELSQRRDHMMMDIWILVILSSFHEVSIKAERLFKKKIKHGHFDETLLIESITRHGDALSPFFPQLLNLATNFLRNTETIVQKFGSIMYRHIFLTFTSIGQRQNYFSAILFHVGSSNRVEKSSALDIIMFLLEKRLQDMRVFSQLLQGTLDYLEGMPDDLVKKLYDILAVLSFKKTDSDVGREGGTSNDLLSITILKQLSNGNPVYTKMGCIGLGSIIQYSGSYNEDYKSKVHNNGQELSKYEEDNILSLLERALKACHKDPVMLRFLYDQIAGSVRPISEKFRPILSAKFYKDFSKEFFVKVEDGDIPPLFEKGLFKRITPMIWDEINHSGNLSNDGFCVPILAMVLMKDQREHKNQYESILNGIAMLRLVCSLQKVHVIHAGLLMFDDGYLKEGFSALKEGEKDQLCLALFFAINWIRELISISTHGGCYPSDKGAILIRLQDVVRYEKILDEFLFRHPKFNLAEHILIKDIKEVKEHGKEQQTLRKEEVDKDEKKKGKKGYEFNPELKNLTKIRPYMREMDISYFEILKHCNDKPSNTNDKKLMPAGLYYLLQDLDMKISTVLKRNSAMPFASTSKIRIEILNTVPMETFLREVLILIPKLIIKAQELNILAGEEDQNDEENDIFIEASMVKIYGIVKKILDETNCPLYEKEFKHLMFSFGTPSQTQDPLTSAFNYWKVRIEQCTRVGAESITLLNILGCLTKNSPKNNLHGEISKLGLNLLTKSCRAPKKEFVEPLLEYIFSDASSDTLIMLTKLVDRVSKFVESGEKKDTEYPALQKSSVKYFAKMLMSHAANKMSDKLAERKDKKKIIDIMQGIKACCDQFAKFVDLTRNENASMLTGTVIQAGRKFAENFLKCLNWMKKLKEHGLERKAVKLIEGIHDMTTRIQTLCANTKTSKSSGITKEIPIVKQDLEKIIYSAKELVKDHPDAFAVKNLHTRDLDDNVISKNNAPDDFYNGLAKKPKKTKKSASKAQESGQEDEQSEKDEEDNGENLE